MCSFKDGTVKLKVQFTKVELGQRCTSAVAKLLAATQRTSLPTLIDLLLRRSNPKERAEFIASRMNRKTLFTFDRDEISKIFSMKLVASMMKLGIQVPLASSLTLLANEVTTQ